MGIDLGTIPALAWVEVGGTDSNPLLSLQVAADEENHGRIEAVQDDGLASRMLLGGEPQYHSRVDPALYTSACQGIRHAAFFLSVRLSTGHLAVPSP